MKSSGFDLGVRLSGARKVGSDGNVLDQQEEWQCFGGKLDSEKAGGKGVEIVTAPAQVTPQPRPIHYGLGPFFLGTCSRHSGGLPVAVLISNWMMRVLPWPLARPHVIPVTLSPLSCAVRRLSARVCSRLVPPKPTGPICCHSDHHQILQNGHYTATVAVPDLTFAGSSPPCCHL